MNPKKKIVYLISLSILWIVIISFVRPDRKKSEYLTKYYWADKTHTEEKFDFVFVGDSRLYRGLSPNAVVEGTEYTAYNFGYSSGSMSERMLDHAEKHLDKSDNPTVILAISPHALTNEALKDEHFLQEESRSSYDLFERKYLSKYLYYFDRITPEEMVGRLDHLTTEICHEDGWMSSDNKIIDEEDGIKRYQKVLTGNPISDEAMSGLMDRVRKWVDSGIRVFAYRPPTSLRMELLEESITGFDETEFRSTFEESGGIWIDVDKEAYQTYDGSHLKKDEVIKLSKFLRKPLGIE